MDSQAQLHRNQGHHQAEEPIRIHHPEEEKGPSKVLKKVKEKAKKIKKALTKHGHGGHGHGHEHEHEHIPDDHDLDEEDTEQDQQIHGGAPRKTHIPVKEEKIIPPGTKAFPVVSSSHAKPSDPTRGVDPLKGSYASHEHQAQPPSRPAIASDVSENEKRRDAATLTPHNTPVSLLSSTEERREGMERDLPEKSLGYEIKPESGPGREIRVRNHEFDVKSGSDQGGVYGSTVSAKWTPIYDKVKETGATVMTKLPFSGGGTGTETGQDKGVSAREYLTEKLSPGEEDKALSEVVAREYLTEKLSPGEEDKALSEVVTEKLHLGGENTTTAAPAKKGVVTQSEEVEKRLGGFSDPTSKDERKHGEAVAEEGEGGMVEKLRDAVNSWIAGTTEEVVQKSTESSAQSLGNTVGNIAAGKTDGGDNKGSVNLQKRFQDSEN